MKIIEEMSHDEHMDVISKFDALPERVKAFIWDLNKNLFHYYLSNGLFRFTLSVASYHDWVKDCESPIEQLLMIAMCEHFASSRVNAYAKPQVELTAGGHDYRVDFLLTIIDDVIAHMQADNPKEFERHLVIECDGHDFHEKTKQQAQKDKQRERNLQIAGYPVMRFTGSEIYKDPMKCSTEIENYIRASRGQ